MAVDEVRISRLVRGLAMIIAILALLDLGTLGIRLTGHDHLMGLIPLIDVNEELNIPSFFSGLLWVFNAMAMYLLATYRASGWLRTGWKGLACVALFMAYDELFSVHEHWDQTGSRLAEVLLGTVPFFAWTLVGAPVVLAVVLFALTIFFQLDRQFRLRLVIAAALFVLGALGFETLESMRLSTHDRSDLIFHTLVLVEEVLEMVGALLSLRACLLELHRQQFRLAVIDA